MRHDQINIGDELTSGRRVARTALNWEEMVVIDVEEMIEQPAVGANHTRISSVVDSQNKPQTDDSDNPLASIKANIMRLRSIDWGRINNDQIEALAFALDDFVWDAQFAATPAQAFQKMKDEVDAAIATGTVRDMFDANGNFIEP